MSQLTQDSLIAALVALRKNHPELPNIAWEISTYCSEGLRGHGHTFGKDLQVLEQYAAVIGGQLKEAHRFTCGQGEMQSFTLKGEWADVPFVLTGHVTLAVYAAYLQEHPLAVAA